MPGVLREPLTLAGLVEVAAVDSASHVSGDDAGRFPVLARVGSSRVLGREHGVQGWLWTRRGGSALPILAAAEDAPPNLALVLARPLGAEVVARCFEAAWVRALAERSPLGAASVAGLLTVVADARSAEDAFRQFGLLGPVTDREVPPTLRRHLPKERRRPPLRGPDDEQARLSTSIPPPGRGTP